MADKPEIKTRDSFGVPKCGCRSCPQCSINKMGRCACKLRGGGPVNSDCVCRFAVQRMGEQLDQNAGLFDAVEEMIRVDKSGAWYNADTDQFSDPRLQAVYAAYNARIDQEDGA